MKALLTKLIVLLAVFLLVIAGYMIITYEKPETPEASVIMGEATLPVVNFKVCSRAVNYVHGYTMDMNVSFMRDCLTVVGDSGIVDFTIQRYGNNIVGIAYEIRSLDGERLIEDEELEDWTVTDNEVNAKIKLSSLIKSGEEYMLIIKLSTERETNIRYYSRIIKSTENDLEKHMDFVEFFSAATLDDETAQQINKYREYDATVNQNNLGYVDIYCSQDQLAWGNLQVEQVTKPVMTIKEMYSVFGEYTMEYVVRATNDYDTYQYYNVTEYFRLRQGISEMYVYSYERAVNQIFDANSQNISTTRINLGIDSDLSIEYLTSANGSYVSFVKENALWCMNLKNNKAISVFTFTTDNFTEVRENNRNHDINIISVDNRGNIMFIVYGYMNRGEHEGKNGISIYKYDASENEVKEIIFVESDKEYSILKETAGRLAYINEKNIAYIMLEDSIYSINLESNESVQIAKGLDDGNFVINDANTIVAWHENGLVYGAESIRVINIETGSDYIITAPEGDYVRVLGFVGNDFAYGIAHSGDISEDEAGYTTFPMYKLVMKLGGENSDASVYTKENIYITDIEIINNMIMLTRVKKEDGKFVETSDDRYINGDYSDGASAEVGTISTTLKKTELTLTFSYTITSPNKIRIGYPGKVEFSVGESIALGGNSTETGKYYVYARGRMYGRYERASDALRVANNMYGLVVDWDGKFVWGRIMRPNQSSISDIVVRGEETDSQLIKTVKTLLYIMGEDTSAVVEGMTPVEGLSTAKNAKCLDFSGGELANCPYFLSKGCPVITKYDGKYVLLTGYTGTISSIDSYQVLDIETGKTSTVRTSKLEKGIIENNSIFLVVY
ncbi:MAG: hypothetical protein E7266_03615 [Lachnospiraceae bacterium]|nr:hypothetical protein [Lachnospiraceae bacterium]